MAMRKSRSRWTALLILVACGSGQLAVCAPTGSRNLNPYHQQQLDSQIRKCASGVMACTDAEERSLKQQELCQLLIRAERYDEAVQVAHNIYQAEPRQTERRAAYHFLVAEIYNRKMQAASTIQEMEESHRAALSAAQGVLEQKYPAKWHVSQYAKDLVKDLQDSQSMARVRQRVASRQGSGDPTKEAIADAQRRYLDATQGGGGSGAPAAFVNAPQPQLGAGSAKGASVMAPEDAPGRTMDLEPRARSRAAAPGEPIIAGQNQQVVSATSLPSEPQVTRVVSPMQRLSTGEQQALDRLGASGLLTSQPGLGGGEMVKTTVHSPRQPILINGQPAQSQLSESSQPSPEEIRQNNLAQLLEAAKKRRQSERRSPYATGQLPEIQ